MNNIRQSLLSTCIATSPCRYPDIEHLADVIALSVMFVCASNVNMENASFKHVFPKTLFEKMKRILNCRVISVVLYNSEF